MSNFSLPCPEQWDAQVEQATARIQVALRIYQPTSEQMAFIIQQAIADVVERVVNDMTDMYLERDLQVDRESLATLTQAIFGGVSHNAISEK